MTPRVLSFVLRPLSLAAFAFSAITVSAAGTKPQTVASPDGRLRVEFHLTTNGAPRYTILREGKQVLQPSKLGLVREDADFTTHLNLVSVSPNERVRDKYEILTAKRRINEYRANRRVFHLENEAGGKLDIIFQVSNDGVAFRYLFPETNATVHKLTEEVTSFHFLRDARAWLQPMAVAKSGWKQTNPSYEEYYEMDIAVGTPSRLGAGWVFPALFHSGNAWVLISETGLGRNYCGTRLRHESPDGQYSIDFPDVRESMNDGPVSPESTLPWATPWRVIVVGDLKTVTESMLGVDLADKLAAAPKVTPKPGKASWSWPLLGDDKTVYDVQKQFIDYAAEMGWRYCLIDAMWDTQIGYEKIAELVTYARGKGVDILLWYNSNGDWNEAPQTPRNRMLTHESRIEEFEKLKAMGVAGLKVDFFAGDGQSVINYYHDILQDSAAYGFMMNFHGATLPRGWQRTYPHLMTMEAVRGLEFYTFEQPNAEHGPSHGTMLPFTRNVFDPMDFTPVVLDRINRIERRTTSAYELATAVVFTSGIQHYAEIPDGMAKAPLYVRDFLKSVPSVWEDTKFLAGEPGKYVVLARKGDGRWYVAGLNGESTERTLKLDLSELGVRGEGSLIADGEGGNLSFRQETVRLRANKQVEITLPPRGGFVMVLQ